MSQLSLGSLGGIVLAPDVLEEQRGAWCSPKTWTARVGVFGVDPFTNPRSTLRAVDKCMLERGDDGFGLDRRSAPGAYYINPKHCASCEGSQLITLYGADDCNQIECPHCGYHLATFATRVWIQPPYDIVLAALAHYGHTRFTALLRLDTSTDWYEQLWGLSEVIMVPHGDRIEFDPPPGVTASSNPFPHGFFYKRAEDVTPAMREHCYAWPTPQYPWASDPLGLIGGANAL